MPLLEPGAAAPGGDIVAEEDRPRTDPAVLGRLRCRGEACEADSGRRAGIGFGPELVADMGRRGLMMENWPSTLEKLVAALDCCWCGGDLSR